MSDLIKLTNPKGDLRILDRSAVKYRDIGTILLNDESGAIVDAIALNSMGNPIEAVRMIYTRWVREDEDHSWKKLIRCFRDVQLNSLARDIEQHFRVLSQADQEGIILSACTWVFLL